MSECGDDAGDMPGTKADAAFDDALRGRIPPAPGAAADALSSFVTAVRSAGATPASPSPALAAFLASGSAAEKASQPAGVAASCAGPAPHLTGEGRTWRLRAVARTAPDTLLAKLAGLGAVARGLAGLAVVTIGVGLAGAAGALPASAQAQFDQVVRAVVPGAHPTQPANPSSDRNEFGTSVSEDAKDGGVDGGEISERAKQNGNRPEDAGKPSTAPIHPTGKPAVPGPPTPPPGLSNRPSPLPTPHPTGPPTPR